jgi:uncharacterized repeat protein (TIGR01451 family)
MPRCGGAASRPAGGLASRRLAGAWWCAAAGVAAAQSAARPPELVVSSTLERLAAPDGGGGVSVTADTVASHADQLIVSVRFTNAGGSVLDTVRVTSPIPADVKYVPGSASGPGSEIMFSVDNGRSFGQPAELKLLAPDGGFRAADAADYTHVRWVLSAPLAAGASGIARFRAVPR